MAFSFIQITDHHLTASESILTRGFSTNYAFRTVLRHIAEHAAEINPSFIVSTGDLGETDPSGAYRAAVHLLRARVEGASAPGPVMVSLDGIAELPMYFLPGNHDDLAAMFRLLFPGGHGSVPASAGTDRMDRWFEHGGVRFVCLDWGRADKAHSTPTTFEFLSAALEDEAPAVILTHHQVAPSGAAWLDRFIADDVARFWDALRGKNVLGILSGHVHMTTETGVDGIPVLTLRGTGFQFARQARPLLTLESPHYRVVTIDGGVLTSKVVEVAL
jgi:3',5'-cyclic AMP phosphodiesterase CpdA